MRTARTIQFCGFSVSIQAGIHAGKDVGATALRVLLDAEPLRKASDPAVLTVELVESLAPFETRAARRNFELLLGDGFALDYAARTLYFPFDGRPPLMVFKNIGLQNKFTRTAVFAIALLAEYHGANSAAATAWQGQAPLYLHASAVLTSKGALVFCGRSTFGKSTIASELLSGFTQIEDDQATILVGPESSGQEAAGRTRSAAGSRQETASARPRVLIFDPRRRPRKAMAVPLEGIFWLKKSPSFDIEPMDRAEAASLLLSPMVNRKNPDAIRHRLRQLRGLLQCVPCRRLFFRKENTPLVELLRKEGLA